MVDEVRFPSSAAAARALAQALAEDLRRGIARRRSASLVLSGGREFIALFKALRKQELDWSKVWITLADERWVAPESEESHEHRVREHLLTGAAAAARFVPLRTADPNPIAAVSEISERLQAMPRPFDAVVLGMGSDGHTAALFPGMPALDAMLNPRWMLQVATATAPTLPRERVTLTLRSLIDTQRIYVLVSGRSKLSVYEAARDGATPFPVGAILRQKFVPVSALLIAP
ncbi:MAG: 6-phosphogluconolactonase [Panacagrimonas sp.]